MSIQTEFIARGVVLQKNAFLLCQNRKHGYFFLPGGHIDPGEPAQVALERELDEELGAMSKAGNLVGVVEARFNDGQSWHHEINLVFHVESCLFPEGEPRSLEKKISFEWVNREDLGSIDFRPFPMLDWLTTYQPGMSSRFQSLMDDGFPASFAEFDPK